MENAVETESVSGDFIPESVDDSQDETLETQDEVTEEEETNEEESTEEDKPKKKGGFQRKIERLEAEKKQMEEELHKYTAWQQQEAMKQQQAQYQQQHLAGKPTLEQFNYDTDAYEQAVSQWVAQGVQAQQQAQQRMYQQQMQMQRQMQEQAELNVKMQSASEKYPDWHEVVMNPAIPPLREVNPAAFEYVKDSPVMADIGYYLAKNPAEIDRLAGLNPLQTAREVAKLEAKFSNASVAGSSLPPTQSVKGKGKSTKDPDSMPIEEWVKWRNNQLKSA